MQELFYKKTIPLKSIDYNGLTMAKRLTKPRPKQGQNLVQLRMGAGLSQYELAHLIGEPQSNVAFWERSDKPPRSDALPKIANVLGARIEDLLIVDDGVLQKKNGPTGRVRKIFEEVSMLPRRQQEKVIEFVSAFVKQYAINEQK